MYSNTFGQRVKYLMDINELTQRVMLILIRLILKI